MLVRTQPNVWIHIALASRALALAVVLRLPAGEIALVILTIGLVLTAEAFNTAIETLADVASPGYHPLVRTAKDVAAAGVLLAALAAIGVAVALFGPRVVGPLPLR